ncbi:MAG: ABC-F family ATP-binding cassette domain-containing protein [Anaerolineales bacterium]|nr:ABC-F family ATP-binding cassette domain-containing protein [Anaerolineales bacterium]
MISATLETVTISFGTDPVFADLFWEIHDDRTAGLVGPNGCGKSTLLKLVAGELAPDAGRVVTRQGLRVGYLPQDPVFPDDQTLLDIVLGSNATLQDLETALQQVETSLAEPDVYGDQGQLERVLARQESLLEQYTRLGGASYEGRVRTTLHEMGFTEAELALPPDALSGGQKKLAGLASLVINEPDLLLLDEPDNHLDYEGKRDLVNLIHQFKGGVVIVSHDRYLLDLVADEIVELEAGRLKRFPGNYSEYAFEKQQQLLRQQQLFQAQQKEITRLERSAKRLLTWGRVYDNEKFIRRGQSMLKRIDKIERIDRPNLDPRRMGLELKGWRGSNKVLEVRHVRKAFFSSEAGSAETVVLEDVELLLWHGERVGLVGPNGAGKSLLYRLILGQDRPTSGEIILGPSIQVGYYAQEHETLQPGSTLIDTIRRAAPLSENEAVSFLGRFLFTYEQARGWVRDLSGGERSRLQLSLLMLSGANFLLLDEPTNNLDIPSAEVLEDALEDFDGAVLVISHDRYFLDRVVGRIADLEAGRIREFPGNYSDFLEAKEL